MDIFSGGRLAEVIALRLDQGEDVLQSVEALARDKDIHTGIVLSGIGTLFVEYEGPIELLSVQGLIAERAAHLHTCVSIKDHTYMGHLEPGCRVLYLAEIAIGRLEGLRLRRVANPETGIKQLRSSGGSAAANAPGSGVAGGPGPPARGE
jgi:predicted DNA-binding protein with PD1-like motif